MASRSAGTLMTEFNAAFVPPALMPGYKGHVPSVASSFGSSYGNTTFKYFQDLRNTALEKSYALLSGGRFPTIFSPNPTLVLTNQAQDWDRFLHLPTYTRSNLDSSRNFEINNFYQAVQQQRNYYQDKTGTVPRVPYFVLPVKERDRYPLPTDLPPLTPKNKWHLLRVSPDYLKHSQTFPSGKRVSSQERRRRDLYFEFRA
ncbi:ciliary microtubule inner protein 2C [Peromyscus maniculatus bairdii]|uniref:Ciliary microtubule inner protein 2C n=1 Tax=Peromyscus maniculatus bairdii TaxID=230844 RepID=A0A6I9MHM7_PERMB|nr:protein FAM166C [Peromyscus maniculatus bairdii]XP_028731484.1 protein FAM166C [Peromyscus leucopus]